MLARMLTALLFVAAACTQPRVESPGGSSGPGSSTPPDPGAPPAPGPGSPAEPPPGPGPAPAPGGSGEAPKLGQPCGTADACGEGTCVTYYGIAGPRGPAFKSCEIRCDPQGRCSGGRKCVTVADGPGQVCR